MGHGTSWIRSFLLPAYYYGTLPCRRFRSQVVGWAGRHPIAVLFYHRVADHTPTPWTISNTEFRRQLEWLMVRCEVITLAEAQHRMVTGRSTRPAVCITFDDGYADNCDRALPWLISRGLPFTYFVATDFVFGGQPFPHDAARGYPLSPNTLAQLRALADRGVEIGAHTRSHADLGKVADRGTLEREITGSRDDLQQRLGREVRYFAFPFGQRANLQSEAFDVAREAGMAGVCSAYGGYNLPGDDPFHLQRIHGDPYFLRFRNWLTFDPRLTNGVPRFNDDSTRRLREVTPS